MFPPIRTGTSFYSRNLAQALADRGNRVTVITVKNEDTERDDYPFPIFRIPALHLPFKNYFKHFRVTSLFPWNYITVTRIARGAEVDVVLLVNHYLDIAFPAIAAARRNSIPLVCSVGTQLQSPNPRRHLILNFLDRLICGKLIFPFCQKIISWDNEVLRYLNDVHGNKVVDKSVVINYGVNGDPEVFLQHQHDYDLHNQIIGVGAVTEQRDFTPLVKALKLIADEFPQLCLKIAGHIYWDAAIHLARELGLADRIIFTGELPHSKVLKEIKRSDVFFVSLTGKYIGLGTATIESMMLGVPTIANVPNDLLGKVVLKNMEDIMLLDGTSPNEIAVKLRRLLNDKNLRALIGSGGRQFVTENMSWAKIAQEMEMLFASVACNSA